MIRSRLLALMALVGVSLLLGPSRAMFSQILTGDILGTVKDTSGAVVPNAEVILTNVATGVVLRQPTDDAGNYLFARLTPGHYRLEVTKQGFETSTVSDIVLLVGQRPAIPVTLHVGRVAQTIQVSAGGVQLLDTQTSSMGQVIQGRPIVDLPLNGRDYLQLAVISTGVEPTAEARCTSCIWSNISATATTVGTSVTVSMDGLRDTNNDYLVDGFETRSMVYGGAMNEPSVDSIQEFKVETSNYSAESGGAAGLVSVVLKPGTNTIHGSLYEFIRNNDLDANSFFGNLYSQPLTHYERNDYGGSIGGPVFLPHIYNGRDKTFWFISYEGERQEQAGSGATALVPSVAQLNGDLSNDSSGMGYYPTSSSFCQQNPTSTKCVNVINPYTGQPFPGNIIPASMISPTSKLWFPYMPAPNIPVTPGQPSFPASNYLTAPLEVNNWYNLDVRGDQTISSKDQLSATITWGNSPITSPGVMPDSGIYDPNASHMIAFTETHSFSPTVLNQAGIGYTWNRIGRIDQGSEAGTNYAEDVWHIANINDPEPGCWGVPELDISTFTSAGSSADCFENTSGLYQFRDNLSIFHGNHNIMMGASLMALKYYELDSQYSGVPEFNISGQFTHAPLGDFLLGYVSSGTDQQGDIFQNLRQQYWSGYLQDDWRFTPHLTLNLGFRYQYNTVPFDLENRCSEFNDQNGQLYTSYNNGGVKNCVLDPDWHNFAPRIGFAYSPGTKKTVFRGGFGIFYVANTMEELEFFSTSLPGITATAAPVSEITNPIPQYTFSNGTLFPNALSTVSGTLPQGTVLFNVDQHNRTPYVEEWNADLQRQVSKGWVVDLGYVGNAGIKLLTRTNLNVAPLDPSGTTSYASRAPYPYWGNRIYDSTAQGWSSYNGLTLRVEKRVTPGMYLLGSYTYSHAFDTGLDNLYTVSTDTSAAQAGHLNSSYDVPNRAVISYLLQLPVGRGKKFLSGASPMVDRLVGGWELNGITTFSSGQYPGIGYGGPDLNYDNLNIGGYIDSQPDQIGDPILPNRNYTDWWNVKAFAVPGCPTAAQCPTAIHVQGNAPANSLEAPGFQDWDLALIKNTRINERVTTELRAEFFNAWNNVEFGVPNGGVDTGAGAVNPSFGLITGTRAPAREIQFGLKLIW